MSLSYMVSPKRLFQIAVNSSIQNSSNSIANFYIVNQNYPLHTINKPMDKRKDLIVLLNNDIVK